MPPASEVPPITAAAMTLSSVIVPVTLAPALRRAVMTIEARPQSRPISGEDLTVTRRGVDAGELGALRVAAQREDVAAEAVLAGHDGHDERRRAIRISTGIGMPMATPVLRLLVGVHHHDEAER